MDKEPNRLIWLFIFVFNLSSGYLVILLLDPPVNFRLKNWHRQSTVYQYLCMEFLHIKLIAKCLLGFISEHPDMSLANFVTHRLSAYGDITFNFSFYI